MPKKMKIIKFIAISLLIAGATSLSSCKKEGPVGPKGDTGLQGNANVKSGIVTISNWMYDGTNKNYTATIIDNDITQNIVDAGVVMAYLYQNGANLALPTTIYPTSSYSSTLSFIYGLQQVIIRIQDSDLTQPNYPGSLTFRIVKVAPSFLIANPNIDWEDYAQVKHVLNLE